MTLSLQALIYIDHTYQSPDWVCWMG